MWGKLSRIELWRESIESFWMYGFELRGIDAPLIRCDLQSREHWGQVTTGVPSLVATDDTAGPVNQCQVLLEIEQNARLGFIDHSVFEE